MARFLKASILGEEKMDFFVESALPNEEIVLPDCAHALKVTAEDLALLYGLHISWTSSEGKITNASELLIQIADRLAWQRERTGKSNKVLNGLSRQFQGFNSTYFKKSVSILGSGLIVEALAKHFSVLEWNVRTLSPTEKDNADFEPGECFVLSGETLVENEMIKNIFDQMPAYVGIVDTLAIPLLDYKNLPIFTPAGLDIGAKNSYEVGLSVVAEILKEIRQMY